MNRVALIRVAALALAAVGVGFATGLVVWVLFDRLSIGDIARMSIAVTVVVGLFGCVGLSVSPTLRGRREACPGCGMELAGMPGEACSRCGLRRAARAGDTAPKTEAIPCKECGYDLAGNTSQTCPECGVYVSSVGTLQTLLSRNLGLSGWCACCGEAVKLPPGEPCPRCHSRYRSATKPANT
ncbi:MAG: hypothetical protein AABZ53_06015 [Planctomycetota bacterium]